MMPPERKRIRRQRAPRDTLRKLPNDIIYNILRRLPLRDAVRTSILSKKWRYIWSKLPQLTLDQTLWETTKVFKSSEIKFKNIVRHLLTLHSGPIKKFTLSIPTLGHYPKFHKLMYFLSKNGIQDLSLRFQEGNLYDLPSSLFKCLQMRCLDLKNCIVSPPSAFRGFDKLVTLSLCKVWITSELLESLITHSPLLENLDILLVINKDHIQVNALNLRTLSFVGNIKYISLKDVPLLETLSLWEEPELSVNAGQGDISTFFESCPSIENIRLNRRVFKFFAAGAGVPTKLPYDLNRLKRLCLHYICLSELDEVSCAFCLIRSSPHLQHLKIQVFNHDDNEIPSLDSLDGFADVTFNRLRTVEVEDVTGTKLEMQLIKLLLGKSPVLERMQIKPAEEDNSPETRLKVVEQITRFHHASTEAEVVYNVDHKKALVAWEKLWNRTANRVCSNI